MSKAAKRTGRIRSFFALAFRLVVMTSLLLAGLYAFYYVHYSAEGEKHFHFRAIHFSGLENVSQEGLEELIGNILPSNSLHADLDRVRKLIESESWVREARVRRRLPGELFVEIEERRPAALAAVDQELYLVDAEGVMLDRYHPRYQWIEAPIAKGLSNTARENTQHQNSQRMQAYLRVLEEFRSSGQDLSKTISEIDVRDPDQIAVIPVDEPIPILLGKTEFRRRYQIFLSQKDLYYRLKQQYGQIKSVDVSFENKIIFNTPEDKPRMVNTTGRRPS